MLFAPVFVIIVQLIVMTEPINNYRKITLNSCLFQGGKSEFEINRACFLEHNS